MTIWSVKLKAFSIHMLLSLMLALMAGWLVFRFWYPYPFWEISGGRELFILIVCVDVVVGPLITFVVFHPSKSHRERFFDLSLVGLIQLTALLYGIWSVAEARPLHVVFEYSRFRVVHAVDIQENISKQVSKQFLQKFWARPSYLSLRTMTADEQLNMTLAALAGVPLAARPELWQPYEAAISSIFEESKPVTDLKKRFPEQRHVIDQAIENTGLPSSRLRYLPLLSRNIAWTVLIDAESAHPVGFIALDPF